MGNCPSPWCDVFGNAASQSLISTLVDFSPPNSPISNEAVQYYSTELDDCHHISSEMNIFLPLLEDRNLII